MKIQHFYDLDTATFTYVISDVVTKKCAKRILPLPSNLFSEIIAVWMISTWQALGRPKRINIVELGPGDGCLIKVLINVFKKFPDFNSAKKIYLYEESEFLKNLQKNYVDSVLKDFTVIAYDDLIDWLNVGGCFNYLNAKNSIII